MYAGSLPWALPKLVLGVAHSDYYGENVPAGTLNLRDNAYLLPVAGGVIPVER